MAVTFKPAPGTVNLPAALYSQPLQGQLCNCPFMAALSAITWVNKTYIQKNVAGPNVTNYYTFTFWDYPGGLIPLTSGRINPVNASGAPIPAVPVPVTVKAATRLLDENNQPQNANGYYGAGCTVAGELWPVLYEKAYAKFCLYKKGSLRCADLTNGNIDPGAIFSLTKEGWGGNAVVASMCMTGLDAYIFPTNLGSYSGIGGADCAAGDLFFFLRYGFCSEATQTFGMNKTKYPMAAWTYTSDNPDGSLFGQKDISPSHCFSILGIFIGADGKQYVILRDTNGLHDPASNSRISTPPATGSIWKYSDVQFKVGPLTTFTTNSQRKLTSLDLTLSSDAVFGLEKGDFQKYFSHFGWVKGY